MTAFLPILARFWYVIPIILLTLGLEYYKHDAKDAHNDLAVFKSETKAAAVQAELENQKVQTAREKVSNAQISALQSSYADVAARYAGLRAIQGKGNAGSGGLPAVPPTSSPANDAARNQRFLDLLQFADNQTAQLMSCQDWIRKQADVK